MRPKNILVIDSSVAVKWLNNQDELFVIQADKILKDVQKEKACIIMPELAKYEIANALLHKKMLLPNTLGSLATFYSIPIEFIPQDQKQTQSAIEIAYANKITFYDASFMALAKERKAKLVTDNTKHQGKAITGFKIVSLKDYK